MRAHYSAVLAFSVILATAVSFTPVSANENAPAKRTLLAFEIVQLPPTTVPCEKYQGSFMDQTAEAMLLRLGVEVAREDRVSAFPDPALSIGSTLTVCRAPIITIKDGKSSLQIRSWQTKVNDILAERDIEVGEQDIVKPPRDSEVVSGNTISITRVALASIVLPVVLPFAVQNKDDATLERGKTRVEQEGVSGLRKDTYLVRREDGIEVSRKKTDSTVVSQPVPKIVIHGTKIIQYGTGIASFYSGNGVGPLTAAHRTLPKGTRVRVVNIATGASVTVVINDRGPFIDGRIIDLSKDAFAQIASLGSGIVNVRVEAE